MSDMYERICPLLFSQASSTKSAKCRGQKCAFAAPKQKQTISSSGKTHYEPDGWYCLVREFFIAMASGE